MTTVVNYETGEITEVHPEEAGAVAMLTQAISALTIALDEMPIGEVVNLKAKVATVATATKELGMSKEAQELAAEAVRRAEWSLGRAIRKGQAAGDIRRDGQRITPGNQYVAGSVDSGTSKPGPADYISTHEWTGNGGGIAAIVDGAPGPEEFEAALDAARKEGNLSRANVARKVHGLVGRETRDDRARKIGQLAAEGYRSGQIAPRIGITEQAVRQIARDYGIRISADEVTRKGRRVDSNRVLSGTAEALSAAAFSIQQVSPLDLDREAAQEWVDSLTESLSALRKAVNSIKESLHG